MCALTATACTDTLDEAALPKPLSVDVNARDITARAPIHGTALPDASSIGISLLAEDGTAYDGVTYANLKYTASGTAPDQTWSTPNIPTLSSTSAKLVAYYPWADGTDYTAVPVETSTQTDYMYSGWVSGLSNANNEAYIVMKHALTAVRVALVKGDFTADVDVSSVSVKSPAFATAGSLDATTGALSELVGTGEAVTVTADFPLTAQATNVEVMAVPDVSVAAGVTTVTTQIGGRKYSVNINFTESYKQGYIYTYTLTLNNTGMEVTSVAVTPWQEGTQDNGDLGVEDKKYRVKINIDDESFGVTYAHNVVGFVGTIDWGDGTTSTYDKLIGWPTHDYTAKGEYTVTATGTCTALMQAEYENGIPQNVNVDMSDLITGKSVQTRASLNVRSAFITEVLHIGKDMGIFVLIDAFDGQKNLVKVHNNAFKGLTECFIFERLFRGCYALQNIPKGLFDNCTKAETFKSAFSGCIALESIPAGLFDKCTEVTEFYETFENCRNIKEIPAGLFDNNTKVTDFGRCFASCVALTAIPAGLFDNNHEVTGFNSTFEGCTGITSIPEGLFDNNPKVTNFAGVFQRTKITVIPAGLFKNNTKAEWFGSAFYYCSMLQSVPAGLFDNCTKALGFSNTFGFCTKLTGESPYTTINVDGADVKVHLYERSSYPAHFATPTSYNGCFFNSSGLTDYTDMPVEWKNN